MVREKSGKNFLQVREKSGNFVGSQGILGFFGRSWKSQEFCHMVYLNSASINVFPFQMHIIFFSIYVSEI